MGVAENADVAERSDEAESLGVRLWPRCGGRCGCTVMSDIN